MSASKKEKAAAGTPKLTGFKGWRRVSPKEAQTIADAAMDLSSAISQSPPAKKKLSLGKAATAWSKHQKQLKSHKKQQQRSISPIRRGRPRKQQNLCVRTSTDGQQMPMPMYDTAWASLGFAEQTEQSLPNQPVGDASSTSNKYSTGMAKLSSQPAKEKAQ